jgi:phage shock protein PspC (stress-responsive transcriptional regulator)
VFAGVAAGIAERQELAVRQVRAMWVVSALLTAGLTFIVYAALAFLLPPPPKPFNLDDYRAG